MPYVTNDDSKAARRITEIEQQLQEAKAEFDRWGVQEQVCARHEDA
jgi:hypothetical protein